MMTWWDRSEIPLDGPNGQTPLFSQRCYQADQVDPQALPAHGHAVEVRLGKPPPLAHRADPGNEDLLGDLEWDYRNIDDFPGPLHPSPGQAGAALRTRLQNMLHPVGRRHPLASKPVGSGLSWPFILRPTLAGFRLNAGHSRRSSGLCLPFQRFNAALQLDNHRLLFSDCGLQLQNGSLLPGDERQQDFAGACSRDDFGVHPIGMT